MDASGQHVIGNDTINNITIAGDLLIIETTYLNDSRVERNTMFISIDVLKADDPIQAARLYRLKDEITALEHRRNEAQYLVNHCNKKLEQLNHKLETLRATINRINAIVMNNEEPSVNNDFKHN